MQDFVLEYVKKKQAEFSAAAEDASRDRAEENAAERNARLIRLGMCRKEYSDGLQYSEDYPYSEHKTGKYYRLVPYTVSDEEYALICRYDDSPLGAQPRGVGSCFACEAARVRHFAVLRFVLGTLLSVFLSAFLYLMESALLLGAILLGILGVAIAFADASLSYAVGKNLKNTEYMLAQMEKRLLGALDQKTKGEEN